MNEKRYAILLVFCVINMCHLEFKLFGHHYEEASDNQQVNTRYEDREADNWKPGELDELRKLIYDVFVLMLLKEDPHQAVSRYYYLDPLSEEDQNVMGEERAIFNNRKNKNIVIKIHEVMVSQFAVFLMSTLTTANKDQKLREAYANNKYISRAEKEILISHHWENIPFLPFDFLQSPKSESEINRYLDIRLKVVSLLKKKLALTEKSTCYKENFERFIDDSLYEKTEEGNDIYYKVYVSNFVEIWCVRREGVGLKVLEMGVSD